MSESEKRAPIEVDFVRGLYGHFSPEFRAHYGVRSLFVRAAADLFTHRAADLMRKANQLDTARAVRERATPEARAALDRLTERVRGGTPLWREAMGLDPIGSMARHVDDTAGRAVFERWLVEFEGERFDAADALLADAKPL